MQTREVFLNEAKQEVGEKEYKDLYPSFDNEYYEGIIQEVKNGKRISKEVYNSLSNGQRYHFNKHYNHRGDKVFR